MSMTLNERIEWVFIVVICSIYRLNMLNRLISGSERMKKESVFKLISVSIPKLLM